MLTGHSTEGTREEHLMASKTQDQGAGQGEQRGRGRAALRPAPDRGRGAARQPARGLRRRPRRLRPRLRRQEARRAARRQAAPERPEDAPAESLRAVSDALREPEKKPKSGGTRSCKLLFIAFVGAVLAIALSEDLRKARPRSALRRRGGVRVQLDDRPAGSGELSTSATKPAEGLRLGRRDARAERRQRQPHRRRDAASGRRPAASPGATFEHVPAQAGVSRGLLHYYFGTKERLLVEVVRRDSESRVPDARWAAARGRRRRRRARRARLQPRRPDRERARLLRRAVRALRGRPAQRGDRPRGRRPLPQVPRPRRRAPSSTRTPRA